MTLIKIPIKCVNEMAKEYISNTRAHTRLRVHTQRTMVNDHFDFVVPYRTNHIAYIGTPPKIKI